MPPQKSILPQVRVRTISSNQDCGPGTPLENARNRVDRPALAIGLQYQDARALGICRIVLDHQFVITMIGNANASFAGQLNDLLKCHAQECLPAGAEYCRITSELTDASGDRWSDWLAADTRDSPATGARDDALNIGHKRNQIGQAIANAMDKDDRQRELRNVLLKGQVAVNGYKYVELDLGERQELTVCYARPAPIVNCLDIKLGELAREARIDAFVEEDLHAASWTASSVARSRNATTWERETEGNPARNSSMLSPASR